MFENFSIDVDLIDENGVTVEIFYVYIDRWDLGETVRCQFSTSDEFKKMEVKSINWYYKLGEYRKHHYLSTQKVVVFPVDG